MLTANIIRAFSFCGQLPTKACQVRLLLEGTRWGNPPDRDRCCTATGQQPSKAAPGFGEMAPDTEIHFERLAVTPEQIAQWNLPTRPTKTTDSRAKRFDSDIRVELDAIEPNQLRDIVREAIERHLPPAQLAVLMAAERSEREVLQHLINGLTVNGGDLKGE